VDLRLKREALQGGLRARRLVAGTLAASAALASRPLLVAI